LGYRERLTRADTLRRAVVGTGAENLRDSIVLTEPHGKPPKPKLYTKEVAGLLRATGWPSRPVTEASESPSDTPARERALSGTTGRLECGSVPPRTNTRIAALIGMGPNARIKPRREAVSA
jgi:hypothetical protein